MRVCVAKRRRRTARDLFLSRNNNGTGRGLHERPATHGQRRRDLYFWMNAALRGTLDKWHNAPAIVRMCQALQLLIFMAPRFRSPLIVARGIALPEPARLRRFIESFTTNRFLQSRGFQSFSLSLTSASNFAFGGAARKGRGALVEARVPANFPALYMFGTESVATQGTFWDGSVQAELDPDRAVLVRVRAIPPPDSAIDAAFRLDLPVNRPVRRASQAQTQTQTQTRHRTQRPRRKTR